MPATADIGQRHPYGLAARIHPDQPLVALQPAAQLMRIQQALSGN